MSLLISLQRVLTVITRYIVALSFPSLVFLMRQCFKSNYLLRATIFKESVKKDQDLISKLIEGSEQREKLIMLFYTWTFEIWKRNWLKTNKRKMRPFLSTWLFVEGDYLSRATIFSYFSLFIATTYVSR